MIRLTDKSTLNSETLGQRIRSAREKQGLSQVELATALDLGQRAISELENGNRKLAVTDLPRMAEVLGVPILYFFGDDIQPNDLDTAILKAFHSLPTNEARRTWVEVFRLLISTYK